MSKALSMQIFKEIDLDNNGTISFEEFLIWHRESKGNLLGGGSKGVNKLSQ